MKITIMLFLIFIFWLSAAYSRTVNIHPEAIRVYKYLGFSVPGKVEIKEIPKDKLIKIRKRGHFSEGVSGFKVKRKNFLFTGGSECNDTVYKVWNNNWEIRVYTKDNSLKAVSIENLSESIRQLIKPEDCVVFAQQTIKKGKEMLNIIGKYSINNFEFTNIKYNPELAQWSLSFLRKIDNYKVFPEFIYMDFDNKGRMIGYKDNTTSRYNYEKGKMITVEVAERSAKKFALAKTADAIGVYKYRNRHFNDNTSFIPYEHWKYKYKGIVITEKLGEMDNEVWMYKSKYLFNNELRLAYQFEFTFAEDPADLIYNSDSFSVFIDTLDGSCLYIRGF